MACALVNSSAASVLPFSIAAALAVTPAGNPSAVKIDLVVEAVGARQLNFQAALGGRLHQRNHGAAAANWKELRKHRANAQRQRAVEHGRRKRQAGQRGAQGHQRAGRGAELGLADLGLADDLESWPVWPAASDGPSVTCIVVSGLPSGMMLCRTVQPSPALRRPA